MGARQRVNPGTGFLASAVRGGLRPVTATWRRCVASPDALPLAVVVAIVVLANSPVLSGAVTNNPLQLFAGLTSAPLHQLLPGQPTIDPNAGTTAQALGHLVTSDWIRGHIPWWNPYEGLGMPLAGEMQSGAFFPPVALISSPFGFALLRMVLETTAGVSTYLLARRLGLVRAAAATAAVAFELCGTFAWFDHAAANPVAFLPMGLLGIERARRAAISGRRRGWELLAVAMAGSLLAGFIEVSYIDGLLVGVWALVRLGSLEGQQRWRLVTKSVTGAAVAVVIAAPALVSFGDFLAHANVGGHSGVFSHYALPPAGLIQLVLPYGLGPIFGLQDKANPTLMAGLWGDVGGYLAPALITAAVIGVGGRRLRPLRVALALWTAIALAKTFGFPVIAGAVTHLPLLSSIAFYRYAPPSWEMAVAMLAAFGIDDIATTSASRRLVLGAGIGTGAVVLAATGGAWPILSSSTGTHPHLYVVVSAVLGIAGVVVVARAGLACTTRRPVHERSGRGTRFSRLSGPAGVDEPSGGATRPGAGSTRSRAGGTRSRDGGTQSRAGAHGRRAAAFAAGAVAGEALVLFAAPFASAPRPAPVDLAAVRYLQAHVGLDRVTTLGPLHPNFGSMFQIPEIGVSDLPVPSAYTSYVHSHLATNLGTLPFTGTTTAHPAEGGPGQQLTEHLQAYEAVGVRYVLVGASGTDVTGRPWPPPSLAAVVRPVYRDPTVVIYELPHPAPHFSTSGSPCTVTATSFNRVETRCARRATLHVLSLWMPGWSATVNGSPLPVRRDGIFQQVALPAHEAVVRLDFTPPAGDASLLVAFVGLVVLFLPVLRRRLLPVVRRQVIPLVERHVPGRRP